MKLVEALEVVVRTDPGVVRAHNEDAVFADPGRGLAILADGMGGYNAGEVASGMATTLLAGNLSALPADFRPQDYDPQSGMSYAHQQIIEQVASTNDSIYRAGQSLPHCSGMGTTLLLCWFYDNMVSAAHIGDSRLYRLREGRFEAITRDHSLLQEQLDSGMITPEEARFSQNKNLVTRALGVDPEVEVEIHDHEVLPGDIYLLCSDGLNDMLEDDEIGHTLQVLGNNLELAGDQLIQMANDNGGRDNISVILIKIRGDFSAPSVWRQRLQSWFQ